MPAVSVSTMKQETSGDASLLQPHVDCQPPSPAPCFSQQQFAVDHCHTPATPRRDVITETMSRDSTWPPRLTSGAVTSESADGAPSCQTLVDVHLSSKRVGATSATPASSSSSALVSSPETGWRAISGCGVGGLWDRPVAQMSMSSPADGEPADVSLVAASPTVGRIPPSHTSDSGSRSSDPLATLMRLYGTLSDDSRVSSPDRHLGQRDHTPAASVTSLPVLNELSTPIAGASATVNNDDYIVRELNEPEDDPDGPTKSYVCHLCQYIGTSRSLYLNHMSEHFKHRCSLCGYMTSYAGRLKRHLEDCHAQNDERPAATQRKPVLKRCRKCGFESANLKLFYDHVRTHIRPERILECPTSSCPFVTEYRHHLELHLRNHLNSRPIRCPICPYRCAVSSMLASHLKSHTKVHRFRCSVCRFSSKFSNALKRHLLEKGHGRGYVLNPDGSIPEGGAVPFEPGSSTSRLRQKVATNARTATTTTRTTTGTAEALRMPTSEVALAAGADVKASIWTPPVAASQELHPDEARRASWRPVISTEELMVKRSPVVVSTSPGTAEQSLSMPPLPASLGTRALYACAMCGFDAGGYVALAQHMMTSHYSAQVRAAVTTPLKRHWPGDVDELGANSWTPPPPPKLPTPQLNSPTRYPVCQPDDKRDFLHPKLPASLLFHQRSPPLGWGSYRSLPQASTAFGSLSVLRAELDALRSSDGPGRVRAEETFRTSELQRERVKLAKSDVVDFPRRTEALRQNFVDVSSSQHWQKTKPSYDFVEHASAPVPVTSGIPLDLSAKPSALRDDQLLLSVQSAVKRSRRKGRAFRVDADRVNSGGRDDDHADIELVGRYSSVTEINGTWRSPEDLGTGVIERSSSGGHEPRLPGDHNNIALTTRPHSGEPRWSDATPRRQTSSTSVERSESSSASSFHECRHCGLGFRDDELFAMHMDFHGRSDPFTCNFCGAATGNQVEFFLHVAHAPHNVRPVYVV